MEISPDAIVLIENGYFSLNATIVFTWVVMALIIAVSIWATRGVSNSLLPSRWQIFLEVIVSEMRRQIRDVSQQDPGRFLAFVGTLFLFIAVANALTIVPGYTPPTGSLSTTAALALCVFVAVPLYGVLERGLAGYLRNYVQPTWFMLPFNVIGELSRTIALAIRLYGNVMSGTIIVGILVSIAPFFFPILLTLLGLLTGLIQAYIFAVLAMVYIASAMRGGHDDGRQDDAEQAPSSQSPRTPAN
ncbi:MAG: F0F1 ATP synthase subunit A [Alphaproteobacteria bacterium]|nr:F0F1 ATP synthase subunit A [Alphaproteobacteria bacterium]